jgi:hypothetical protein
LRSRRAPVYHTNVNDEWSDADRRRRAVPQPAG